MTGSVRGFIKTIVWFCALFGIQLQARYFFLMDGWWEQKGILVWAGCSQEQVFILFLCWLQPYQPLC